MSYIGVGRRLGSLLSGLTRCDGRRLVKLYRGGEKKGIPRRGPRDVGLRWSLRVPLGYLLAIEQLTVKRRRPLARRRAKTLRPSGVDMRARKPCLLTRFLLDG